MLQYTIRRLLFIIPVLFAVSVLTFFAARLVPGEPALTYLGQLARTDEIESWNKRHGLDRPLLTQYLTWLGGILHGDPGESLAGGHNIGSELRARFPVTMLILTFSFTFVMLFGVTFGVLAAVFQGSMVDHGVRLFAVFGQSIPPFYKLTLLMILPAIWWRYAPPFGYIPFWEDPWRAARQVIPPTLVLAVGGSSTLMRITRSSLLEVLRADYVRTARAKGLRERAVILRHAVRNALIPVLTIAGGLIAGLMGGSVILENITSLPGLGQYTFNAVVNRDYNVVMTMVMYAAIVVTTAHLAVDLLYAVLDPRIRYR
jgi:peptide/nickel transport system permease protein